MNVHFVGSAKMRSRFWLPPLKTSAMSVSSDASDLSLTPNEFNFRATDNFTVPFVKSRGSQAINGSGVQTLGSAVAA
jgi:hypothetical protein